MVRKDAYSEEDHTTYYPNQDISDNEERESINDYTRTRCVTQGGLGHPTYGGTVKSKR